MKYLFAVVVVSILILKSECLTEAEHKMLLTIHEKCMPESGATSEMAQRALSGDFPEEPEFKKHMLCISKNMGFMDDAGNFKMEMVNAIMEQKVPDAALRAEITSKCLVVKDTPEETAFQSSKCLSAYKDAL